jgi:WG containing repeat
MRRTLRGPFLVLLFAVVVFDVAGAANKDDLLAVVQNGKYGYIDHEGKVVIRPQFIWAEDFWRGLGSAYVCGRYVSIDSSGAVLPLRIAVEGHLEPKKLGEKFGFIDASGQFRIAPSFDEALAFSEGFAAVRVGDKWGFIHSTGRGVIRPEFKAAFYFREGVGTVESDSGYMLIDKSGKVLAQGFQFVDLVADGRVPVSHGERSGYLDLGGRVAIPLVYDGATPFSGGLAAIEKGDKWGYVNRDGEVVIPLKFDRAGPFGNGLAPAKVGAHTGFIDKSGNFAFSLAFEQAPGFLTGDEESGLFIAPADVSRFWTADGRFGYVNTLGHVIWGPIDGNPDHPPLLGWSEEDKARSCEGVPESTRSKIAGFPDR